MSETTLRHFRAKMRLCGDCDRPSLCAIIAARTAPCGLNELVEIEEVAPAPDPSIPNTYGGPL